MDILPLPETLTALHPLPMSQNDIHMGTDAEGVQQSPVAGAATSSTDDEAHEHTAAHAHLPRQDLSRPEFEVPLQPFEERAEAAATAEEPPEVINEPLSRDVVSLGAGAPPDPPVEVAEPNAPIPALEPSTEEGASSGTSEVHTKPASDLERPSKPEAEEPPATEANTRSDIEHEVSSGAALEPLATSQETIPVFESESLESQVQDSQELSQPAPATDIPAATSSDSAQASEPVELRADTEGPVQAVDSEMARSNPRRMVVTLKYGSAQTPSTEAASSSPDPITAAEMAVTPPSEVQTRTPPRTGANKENFAPGLYARERNSRRAATKAYREPPTPKKATISAPVPTPIQVTAPVPATAPATIPSQSQVSQREARSAKRKASEAKEPAPKRRKASEAKPATRHVAQNTANLDRLRALAQAQPEEVKRPTRDQTLDEAFASLICEGLRVQVRARRADMGKRQALRILDLMGLATYPSEDEALFLTTEEATAQTAQGRFTKSIIVTTGQQRVPLQTVDEFLGEYYDDDALVWIQDPEVKPSKKAPITRQVKISQVKQRFAAEPTNKPWNLLELATHCDDGLRPSFLNSEDCRLLTKLKIPETHPEARRRTYLPGYKEVEKWALVAEAGALTEPHQDSHGYSTFITVNMGLVGFGWLSNPTKADRDAWRRNPSNFRGGQWRYIVLKPGQTVYFPAGTVHFVFRLPAIGNTLAFGGHILRCSNIVHWVRTLIEERDQKEVTNEDLTDSAPGYLARVEKFVNQAKVNGTMDKWGGDESIEEFLRLKQEFLSRRQK